MKIRRLVGAIGDGAAAAAAATLLGLVLTASVAGGQACPCAKRDLATVVAQADVIFVGKPLAATTDSTMLGRQPAVEYQARFQFDVGVTLKGTTARSTTVVSPVGPCQARFAVGTDYLVIGKRQGNGVVTDSCQGNVAGVEAIRARAAAIRDAQQPKPQPSPAQSTP